LREALAAADHDFILSEPASRQNPMLDKPFSNQRRSGNRRRKPRRRYWLLTGVLLGVAAVAGIVFNALILQTTRHPAPLFAKAASPAPVREPAIAETAPAPAPASRTALIAPPAPGSSVEKATSERQGADKAASLHPRQPAGGAGQAEDETADPISAFLKAPPAKAGQMKAAPSKAAPVKAAAAKPRVGEPSTSSTTPSKSVLAAQRALVKLGFVLKPDGVAGLTTRQAIERYERDRGRPVHGALTPALSRQLSAESGVPIN
jgi:hypothetical protein